MRSDNRRYVRYVFEESAMEEWRMHACLSRLTTSRREACYAAAVPFICHIAQILVDSHAWSVVDQSPDCVFHIRRNKLDGPDFMLPQQFTTLLQTPRSCERMFESVFAARVADVASNEIHFAEPPLRDLFHLFQLLAPGCFLVVDAQYISHEVDDEEEIALIRWRNCSRALPSPEWMDHQANFSPALVSIFGRDRWATLRRAAADAPFLLSGDVSFS